MGYDLHSLEEFPEHLRPFLVRALRMGDYSFWNFKAPVPASPGNAVLFSGCYERLDAEYMIPNADYHKYQLGKNAVAICCIFILIRLVNIFICFVSIEETFKYEEPLFIFLLIFVFVNELIILRTIRVCRSNFEPRICFSRKDNAVFAVDYQGNVRRIPWSNSRWHIILTHMAYIGGRTDIYSIDCSIAEQPPTVFHKFLHSPLRYILNPPLTVLYALNTVFKISCFSPEEIIFQRLEGVYNFVSYYMEHGLDGLKVAYANDDVIEKGKLPCGVTLLPPSAPFRPDREFSSRAELIKDAVWRYLCFPFYPKLLLSMRPQLRRFPCEETSFPLQPQSTSTGKANSGQ
jgi:hypothetical protein